MPRIRVGIVLALAGLAAPASASEPAAVLTGPGVSAPGVPFLLVLAGTVSDEPVVVEQAGGPEPVTPAVIPGPDGNPLYAIGVALKPGAYQFAVCATGLPGAPAPAPKPAPAPSLVPKAPSEPEPAPKSARPRRKYAYCTVVVTPAAPRPKPKPEPPAPVDPPAPVFPPDPEPEPGPAPPAPPAPPKPNPAPVAGPLYVMAVYPPAPTRPADVAFLLARDDPKFLRDVLASVTAWRAVPSNDPRVDAYGLRALAQANPGTFLVVYDPEGTTYDLDGRPHPKGDRRAVPVPDLVDSPSVASAFVLGLVTRIRSPR